MCEENTHDDHKKILVEIILSSVPVHFTKSLFNL